MCIYPKCQDWLLNNIWVLSIAWRSKNIYLLKSFCFICYNPAVGYKTEGDLEGSGVESFSVVMGSRLSTELFSLMLRNEASPLLYVATPEGLVWLYSCRHYYWLNDPISLCHHNVIGHGKMGCTSECLVCYVFKCLC